MNLKQGDYAFIHAYKHDGKLYRTWEQIYVYEITDDHIILVNDSVVITEENGRKWKTKEPAIWFFYKDSWFNTICMFKETGINYYSNLASPYVVEGSTIKYIDYDLDIKTFKDHSYKILDLKEFNRNRIEYNYSRQIIEKIWSGIDLLKEDITNKSGTFSHKYANKILADYTKIKNKGKNNG